MLRKRKDLTSPKLFLNLLSDIYITNGRNKINEIILRKYDKNLTYYKRKIKGLQLSNFTNQITHTNIRIKLSKKYSV